MGEVSVFLSPYRNRAKRKETYAKFFGILKRKLHSSGGLVINNIFCAVRAVVWVVLTAPELAVDRKITRRSRKTRSSLIKNVGHAGSLSALSVVRVYVSNTL